jgi:hypothetical protein
MFVVYHDVLGGNKHFFEAAINLAQFPEDHNEDNRHHEQQEWDVHLFSSLAAKELHTLRHSTTRFALKAQSKSFNF